MTPGEMLKNMFDSLESVEDEDHIHFFLDQGYEVTIVGNQDELIFADNAYQERETVYCVSAGMHGVLLEESFFYSRVLSSDGDVCFFLVEPVVTYDWQAVYDPSAR